MADHFKAIIRKFLTHAQYIDRNWDSPIRSQKLAELEQELDSLKEENRKDLGDLLRLRRHIKLGMSHQQYLSILIPLERIYAKTVMDHDFQLIEGDSKRQIDTAHNPIVVIADSLRSAFNVGSIFRSSECFAVQKIYLSGYTAAGDDPSVIKTSMGTARIVAWERHPNTKELIASLKSKSFRVYALEKTTASTSLYQHNFSGPTALVLGNERHGISPEIISCCDDCLSIPLMGGKNSLNVASAFSIAIAEIRRQQEI